MAMASSETQLTQAMVMKEEGNELAKTGKKREALRKYEKGIRLLGIPSYELDEECAETFQALSHEARVLVSILASNAAQMYMDPSLRELGTAILRCTLAIEANSSNAKAHFRRAAAAYEHVDNLAKGTDSLLAQAQSDIRNFLALEEGSAAGKALQEKLLRKRQALMPPMLRETRKTDANIEPTWFSEVKCRAVFVCICGSLNTQRACMELPETLLSMAMHAKDKKSISVGVAYVGTKGPQELEMFDEAWQRKFFRMLNLGERAVRVPQPRTVMVGGETYSMWSLLEGRVRVMRVEEVKTTGEQVGTMWLRYCSQLMWHGEPFVFQSCCSYLRFAPKWDECMKSDLSVAIRRSKQRPVLSWMSRTHQHERWQWVSEQIDHEDSNTVPAATLAAESFDRSNGWVRFRRRYFRHCFGVPEQVAFHCPHNAFSTSDILREVPADPYTDLLAYHGQLTCENAKLHSFGWDVFAPSANFTWESAHDARNVVAGLAGGHFDQDKQENAEDCSLLAKQRVRSAMLLEQCDHCTMPQWGECSLPLPTACFWTTLRREETSPWDVGNEIGHGFGLGSTRPLFDFDQRTGVDLSGQFISERARNAGLTGDADFEDSRGALQQKARQLQDFAMDSSDF